MQKVCTLYDVQCTLLLTYTPGTAYVGTEYIFKLQLWFPPLLISNSTKKKTNKKRMNENEKKKKETT